MTCKKLCPLEVICAAKTADLEANVTRAESAVKQSQTEFESIFLGESKPDEISKDELTRRYVSVHTSEVRVSLANLELHEEQAVQTYDKILCKGPQKNRSRFIGKVLSVECGSPRRRERM